MICRITLLFFLQNIFIKRKTLSEIIANHCMINKKNPMPQQQGGFVGLKKNIAYRKKIK